MNLHHYRFRARWDLPAPPAAVYGFLARAEEYPRWWPQVREAHRSPDGLGGSARVRAFLPYDLRITLRERERDAGAGLLSAEVTGDLKGFLRWTLSARGGGTRADYLQEVEVRSPLLRRLVLPGRPLFRLNHRLMMRSGERGLCRALAERPTTEKAV
ncbi:SRPBCC family protein [Streptomyces sp. NPDC007088]|uniref:SRPBCC family protein n=1 Tax=Streptomyces sp. NPDC007088 TaxID=3364773 RepID=UPI003689206B